MIKIAFMNSGPPHDPRAGGIATYIQHRACVLGKLGFEVWWANSNAAAKWCPEKRTWCEHRLFTASRLMQRLWRRWPGTSPVWRKILSPLAMDIVEFQAGVNSWLPFSGNGPSIVLHCHTSMYTRAFLNLDSAMERRGALSKHWAVRNLRYARAILACSNEVAMLEAGYFHLHPDKITIIPHAFDPLARPLKKTRTRPAAQPIFLVVGNIEYVKGLDLLLHGFEKYRRAGGRGKLWIAGCGGLHEERGEAAVGAIKPILKAIVTEYGAESIKFMGTLSKDQLSQKRLAVSAVVHCSRFEAFTMVAGEAFLSGCPLILSERTGWRHLVERYRAARLVNPYDSMDIASALKELENEARRVQYVDGGNSLADYLTSDDLATKTANFYKYIVD